MKELQLREAKTTLASSRRGFAQAGAQDEAKTLFPIFVRPLETLGPATARGLR